MVERKKPTAPPEPCRRPTRGTRGAVGLGIIALGVAGVYWLMVWDVHFLLLAAFGAGCGAASVWSFAGPRGAATGAVLGFVAPLAYLPLWFVFNLPPDTGIDL